MSSSSGLTFKLHPLVIVNISDHHTRIKAQTPGAARPPRVYGCVLGVQTGRTVEIFNSFELRYDPVADVLDRAFLETKQEQYKKVFPKYDVLGWYSTGSDVQDSDMHIHKALMDINESPVYVLLNPTINHAQKELPISIFESELHVIDEVPSLIFVNASYTIETVEAERISVDHVAHIKPSDGSSAATQLAAHLTGMHSAIKMLNSRIRVLYHHLVSIQKGDAEYEHSLLRQISSLVRRLPAIDSPKFQDDFLMEYNDTLLMTYLATITKCSRFDRLVVTVEAYFQHGWLWLPVSKDFVHKAYDGNVLVWTLTSIGLNSIPVLSVVTLFIPERSFRLFPASGWYCTINELVDKFNTAYDKQNRRGGRTTFI